MYLIKSFTVVFTGRCSKYSEFSGQEANCYGFLATGFNLDGYSAVIEVKFYNDGDISFLK
jgi:hypothetical protein